MAPRAPLATGPSTGSWYVFLFSVAWQLESLCQQEGGLVEGQLVYRRPEVQDVAVGTTGGVEALEHVFAQMRRKRRLRVVGLAVQRTGSAALLSAAAQVGEQTQMAEHLFHAD